MALEITKPAPTFAQTLPDQNHNTQTAEPLPKLAERTAKVVTEPAAETKQDVVKVSTTSQQNHGQETQEDNWKVYKRKRRKDVESSTTQMQNHESNQALGNEVPTGNILPNLEPIDINTIDTDIPNAKGKGVRTCTQHPIERYVSYGKKLRTPLSRGSSLCEGMGEGCCTQSYPCICKEAISGFELMTNKSPRHNFTAAP